MTRAPSTPPAGRKRKHRPLRVEMRAALRAAGIDPDQPYEFQHEPPLALRPFDHSKNDYDPPENDDRHLRPMQTAEHKKVTREVDRPQVDKTRRQAKDQLAHRARMLLKDEGIDETIMRVSQRKKAWPQGRKIGEG